MVLKLKDGRKELYQWDVGVIADVTDENINEVHFSNLRYGVSFNVEVQNGTVTIPPEVLQSGADVFCWAFVRQENGGYTKKEQIFNVEKRPRPADYIYEPTDVLTWETLKKQIEDVETELLADIGGKVNKSDVLSNIDKNAEPKDIYNAPAVNAAFANLEKGTVKLITEQVNLVELETGLYNVKGGKVLWDKKNMAMCGVFDGILYVVHDMYLIKMSAIGKVYVNGAESTSAFVEYHKVGDEWVISQQVQMTPTSTIEEFLFDNVPTVGAVYNFGETLKTELLANIGDKADRTEVETVKEELTEEINTAHEQVSELKSDLNQIKDNVFDVSVNLFDKSAIETGELNVYGNVASTLSTFRTSDFMPVSYPNSIAVQNDNKVSQDRYYICEYDENKTFIGTREELFLKINVTFGTYELTQSNAKYIRISYMPQNTPTDTLMVFVGTNRLPIYQPYDALFVKDSFTEKIKTPIGVNIENEQLSIITKYKNGYDLCVSFNKHGGNNLPDFASLGLIENEDFYPTTEASASVPFLTIRTDIHGPYIVKAKNNIDGDLPNSEHFTGGNHNYNNNGASGYTPTATCQKLEYYVNGNKVTSYKGYAKQVKIIWVNLVQATNTKKVDGTGRNVLKETHTLVFENGKWHSTVEIETLEDVLIKTYYGFQWVVNAVYPNIRFIGGANRGLYNNKQVNTSGNNVVSGIKMFGNEHSARIDLDTTYDIGNRRYYSGTSGAFNSTDKSYFYLMSNVNANANDLYCAKADFIFSEV